MKHSVVGIDIAKRVFQLHWVDIESGEMVSLQLKRVDLPRFGGRFSKSFSLG